MDQKRWYSSWDPRVAKFFVPHKPLSEYVRDNAIANPGSIALSFYGYDMTYGELDNAIDKFAMGLTNLGVQKGDRVGLYMENCPQFVISYFGILRAGGIVVALNPMFKQIELEYEINDSQLETLVVFDYLFPEVKQVMNRVKLRNVIVTSLRDYLPQHPLLPLPPSAEHPKKVFPETIDFLSFLNQSPLQQVCKVVDLSEEIALLQYTGGTTGLPKGAIGTHYTLAHNIVGSAKWFGYTKDDVHLALMPFFHVMGMVQCMGAPLASGGRVIILARFTPEVVAKAIAQYKCTVWQTITTMIIGMVDWPHINEYDLGSLRIVWYGGAPISISTIERLKMMVPKAITGQAFGLTENFSPGTVTPLAFPKEGSVGIPFIGTDLKIVDLETGLKELSPGEEGEIILKGPNVMKGYWNRPEATQETLREGWLYTGDLGKMDENGYLYWLGRKRELIKCSGYSVFPSEVEGILHRYPAIAEVAVIGIPDRYMGEKPKAFVVIRPEYKGKVKEEDILAWASTNMAAYKRPRVVEFRETLPKSGAGKILKRILQEQEEEVR